MESLLRAGALDEEHLRRFRRDDGLYRPFMLFCETVNSCPNACVVCAYPRMTRPGRVMDRDLFARVLADYAAMGGGDVSLTPVVGDVFLDPHLPDRVAMLRSREAVGRIGFTTNAVRADVFGEARLRALLSDVDRIYVSVYGLDEAENQLATKRPFFRQARDNLRRIVDLVDDIGKIGVGFRLLRRRGEDELRQWLLDACGVALPFGVVTEYANWGVLDTSRPLPHDATWVPERDVSLPCLLPLVACQVHADGNVSFCPCNDYDCSPELSLGRLGRESLLELVNGPAAARLWAADAAGTPTLCRRCTFHRPLPDPGCLRTLFHNPFDLIGG